MKKAAICEMQVAAFILYFMSLPKYTHSASYHYSSVSQPSEVHMIFFSTRMLAPFLFTL